MNKNRQALSVLIVSTLAFTVCFMVWMMFAVIGITFLLGLYLVAIAGWPILAIGIASLISPLYIAEISPPRIRGKPMPRRRTRLCFTA